MRLEFAATASFPGISVQNLSGPPSRAAFASFPRRKHLNRIANESLLSSTDANFATPQIREKRIASPPIRKPSKTTHWTAPHPLPTAVTLP